MPSRSQTRRDEKPADEPLGIRQEYQLLTRRRLLNAALQVFEQKGFNGATVEGIVSAAGVARATFYLHFSNKMEVVRLLTEDILPSVIELYEDLDSSISVERDLAETRDVVHRWVRKTMGWYDDREHRVVAFVWQELAIGADGTVEWGISVDQHLPRYVASWPPSARDAARTRVVLLSHLTTRAYFLARQHALPTEDDALIESLTELWTTGLFPPSAKRATRRR